ncbi:MAG: CehA/McbA family metallohydrolase [Planctomycetota bacterium]
MSIAVRIAALLLLSGPAAFGQGAPVDIPPGWISGDTHTHIQRCRICAPHTWCPDPDYSIVQLFEEQCFFEVDVSCQLVWNPAGLIDPDGNPGVEEFLAEYAPLVTGDEDPITQGDPEKVLLHGVEASGFDASQFGHITAIGIHDAAFPTERDFPGPILEFFREQPGAITGYAHAAWPVDYQLPPWYGPPNRTLPFLAPIDLALGRLDYLEVTVFDHEMPMPGFSWRQLYYALLNAGRRPSITGGSDNCDDRTIGAIRTYADIRAETLSPSTWIEAVRGGRTSLSYDRGQFLDVTVGGVGPGDRLALAQPANVTVRATLHVGSGTEVTDTLEIIRDGIVVQSVPFSLGEDETQTFQIEVPVDESSWIAARTFLTHSAAVFVTVSERPIAELQDAQYWLSYCDDLAGNLVQFRLDEDEECAILEDIAAAKEVFQAAASYRSVPPVGVARFGRATASCDGPPAIVAIDAPVAGQVLRIACLNAPREASGWLLVGVRRLPEPIRIGGADIWVDPSGPVWGEHFPLPATSTAGGHAQLSFDIPARLSGAPSLYGQWIWLDPTECLPGQRLSASDAIDVMIE